MRNRSSAQSVIRSKVMFLRRPDSYLDAAGRVDVIETHFAWVFLTDSHAYKIKKPLRQDCMDYRRIAGRERGCRSEVRLNRRLAPSVYLGVIPLSCRRDGSFIMGPGSRVVDWIVAMRRLPADRMLDRLIASDAVTAHDRDALIRLLSRFYRHARRLPMSAKTYITRLRSRTLSNRRELLQADLRLSQEIMEGVFQAQLEWMASSALMLGRRGAHLIEGHGDLRPEHIYLGTASENPAVIDCLEFDPALRRLDPIEEMAFLCLECTRLGAARLARDLMTDIRTAMADPAPDALVYFYMSQRAVTRAKIAAWHLRDPGLTAHAEHWRARAQAYLEYASHFVHLALGESARGRPSLIERHRPSGQKRSQGLPRQDSPQRLAE